MTMTKLLTLLLVAATAVGVIGVASAQPSAYGYGAGYGMMGPGVGIGPGHGMMGGWGMTARYGPGMMGGPGANWTCPGLNAGYADADGDGICDHVGYGYGPAGSPAPWCPFNGTGAYNGTVCPYFQNSTGWGMMGMHGWCHGRS